jgi:hypothetical protein
VPRKVARRSSRTTCRRSPRPESSAAVPSSFSVNQGHSVENTPENLLKEGRLDEALQALAAQVRSHPADAPRRVFMFQLLSLLGQWERAQNQLKVAGELDPLNALMVGAYSVALGGERERVEVFEGKRSPVIIGEPVQTRPLPCASRRSSKPKQSVGLSMARRSSGSLMPTLVSDPVWKSSPRVAMRGYRSRVSANSFSRLPATFVTRSGHRFKSPGPTADRPWALCHAVIQERSAQSTATSC